MCDHTAFQTAPSRRGISLEDGAAHESDHRQWSRRDFLSGLGALGAGAFFLGGTAVRAYGASPLLHQLHTRARNRVLVLVQLNGGNDGLNTIIPYNDDVYYNSRPGIAIAKGQASQLDLNGNLGMHPSLTPFESYFGDGNMAILQNVGYPSPNLSHFRSTDIWQAASSSEVVENTGWLGRYLDLQHPDFSDDPPEFPLAVQIGGGASQMFLGPNANMGMSLISADLFQRLAEDGQLYDANSTPPTSFGDEMTYLRSVANDSFLYAAAIKQASDAAQNSVEYPTNNPLADSLATVARLVKGQLGSSIYHVTLGGFDTHANQLNDHALLLNWFATAMDAFMQDMATDTSDTEVLAMTYSEFGRRVSQNGSAGTDHGAGAPLILMGTGVKGGLFGSTPVLTGLQGGNIPYEIDFRSVYGTVLQDWFGFAATDVQDALLGFNYTPVSFIENPDSPVATEPIETPASFQLAQNYPNPFNPSTTISFSVEQSGHVTLEVFDAQGRLVQTLMNRTVTAGSHTIHFDAGYLPSGTYLYRIVTPHGLESRKMTLLR